MKLLFCLRCNDIVKISETVKYCSCGNTFGKYLSDRLNAEYSGECIPIGISNPSFILAINNQPNKGNGKEFTAFVIPKDCYTMKKIDSK